MAEQDPSRDEIEIEAIGIEIDTQPIELYKVFKLANLVSGGGEAKHIISEGYVAVNGEIELRKRRKIYDGDLIEFNREFYLVICDGEQDEGELPEVFADDLNDEEYLVSEEERAKIEAGMVPSALTVNVQDQEQVSTPQVNKPVRESARTEQPQNTKEKKKAKEKQEKEKQAHADTEPDPSKRKGRKSIQFF